MICNQKSALTTVATAAQTVTANGFVSFPTNNLLTGVSIKHPAGSTSVNLIQTLIEKAISINHKSQEKPVTMQVAGFFFVSVIFQKCPQLIENKLRM